MAGVGQSGQYHEQRMDISRPSPAFVSPILPGRLENAYNFIIEPKELSRHWESQRLYKPTVSGILRAVRMSVEVGNLTVYLEDLQKSTAKRFTRYGLTSGAPIRGTC